MVTGDPKKQKHVYFFFDTTVDTHHFNVYLNKHSINMSVGTSIQEQGGKKTLKCKSKSGILLKLQSCIMIIYFHFYIYPQMISVTFQKQKSKPNAHYSGERLVFKGEILCYQATEFATVCLD